MSFFRQIQWILFCLIAVLVMSTPSFSEDAPLEVTAEGKVIVDGVFHFTPRSEAPEDPEAGDFYYDTENKNLLFFNNGVWNKVTFLAHEWEYSDWSDCSANCGGGTQTRTAVCTRADGVEVPESYCRDLPVTSQDCNTQACKICQFSSDSAWLNCQLPSIGARIIWNGTVIASGLNFNATSYTAGGYLYTRSTWQSSGACAPVGLCSDYMPCMGNHFIICREQAE